VKEKVTQVRLEEEVELDSAEVQRNITTGELTAKIKLLNFTKNSWKTKKTEENFVFRYDKDLVKKMRSDEKKDEITKGVEKKITEKETKKTNKEQLEYENAPDVKKKTKEEINYEDLG